MFCKDFTPVLCILIQSWLFAVKSNNNTTFDWVADFNTTKQNTTSDWLFFSSTEEIAEDDGFKYEEELRILGLIVLILLIGAVCCVCFGGRARLANRNQTNNGGAGNGTRQSVYDNDQRISAFNVRGNPMALPGVRQISELEEQSFGSDDLELGRVASIAIVSNENAMPAGKFEPSYLLKRKLKTVDAFASPLYYNEISKCDDIGISQFPHSRPIPGTKYFRKISPNNKDGISVVIPFFNETATELETTLKTLYHSWEYLCTKRPEWSKKPFDVCIIQDGWAKADPTMQMYLKSMFPKKIRKPERVEKNTKNAKNENKNENTEAHLRHQLSNSTGVTTSIISPRNGRTSKPGRYESVDMDDTSSEDLDSSCDEDLGNTDNIRMGSAQLDNLNDNGNDEKSLEPESDDPYWWEYFEEFTSFDVNKRGSLTFVFEKSAKNPSYFQIDFLRKRNNGEIRINMRNDDSSREVIKSRKRQLRLNLTLIVKLDNRRKHNSHEWFMGQSGFAESTKSKYFLATDAFTVFDEACLYYLINYMDKHPRCSAATGRQRAMTRGQQGLRDAEWRLSMDYILRQAQKCDFEVTQCVYNPAFSLLGFLPVIPGPCGVYRCEDILQNQARNWYFEVVNASPDQTGLVLGNLRIAEDRVLSYASILKLNESKYMSFVEQALFYFEAETDLDRFLYQRRRWINGTFAGYWFLLISNPSHFWKWKVNFVRKLCVWILLVLALLQQFAIFISPAISMTIFQDSLTYLLGKCIDTNSGDNTVATVLEYIIMIILWGVWVCHVIIHNQNKFNLVIMQFFYFISIATAVLFVAKYGSLLFIEQISVVDSISIDVLPESYVYFVVYSIAFATITPVISALLVNGKLKDARILVTSFLAYFISAPLMITWFSSYAFTRCWDLSWGNRPATEEHESLAHTTNNTINNNNSVKKNGITKGKSIRDLVGNPVNAADLHKARFSQYAKYVMCLLIVCNFGVYFLPSDWKALIMLTIFFIGVVFMFISLIVLIAKFPKKYKCFATFCCIQCYCEATD